MEDMERPPKVKRIPKPKIFPEVINQQLKKDVQALKKQLNGMKTDKEHRNALKREIKLMERGIKRTYTPPIVN